MLQSIREKAQGWFAWVIIILIIIPFALWGIQEYLGTGGEPKAAKVNDREISERELDASFQRFRLQMREQLGDAYKSIMQDDNLLRRQVLGSMIRNELLMQAALRQKMQASDEMVRAAIATIPPFQKGGRFDYATYEQALKQQGLSPEQFAERVRTGLVVDQLTASIEESEFTTPQELAEAARLDGQQRELSYLLLPLAKQPAVPDPDEQELQSYYEAHQDAFMVPERVKLEYVELSVEQLAKQVEVDDAKLAAYLESKEDEFRLPEERRAAHILIIPQQGDEAGAKAKAEELLKRLQQGEDFAALASAESQDPASAKQGGDLGFFATGVMDPAFEKAAFALKSGETSALVRSTFGYHIIRLLEVRGGGKADLAKVRDRVLKAYTKEEAQKRFYAQTERFSDLGYESPDSLAPIVDNLRLPLQSSDWITRDGGEGVLKSPKVIGAAFGEDVLVRGNNSEALELGQEQLLMLRVVAHEAAAPKPFQQAKPELLSAIKREKGAQQLRAQGDQMVQQLKSGQSLTELANQSGVELKSLGLVGRDAQQIPAALLQLAFKMPHPKQGQAEFAGMALANGDYGVVSLQRVEAGKPATDSKQATTLARERGNRYHDLYLGALEESADIRYLLKESKSVE